MMFLNQASSVTSGGCKIGFNIVVWNIGFERVRLM